MAFTINNGALYQLFDRPHMKIAIESCVGVVELWPLQTVQEMENDAKYTEDLQVRFSCTMARAMLRLSHGINPSVAEAVYEGNGRDSGLRSGNCARRSRGPIRHTM
ncbi:MAG: hypothetical protein ACLTL8_07445 [Bifidobacterium pseudocatenulatum]